MTEDPLDAIEAANAMSDMAKMLRMFYRELINEGFSANEALVMVMTYLQSVSTQPRNE